VASIRHVRGVCIHYCGRARENRTDVTCVAQSNVAPSQGSFLQLRVSCTSVMSQTAKELGEEKQATRNSRIQFRSTLCNLASNLVEVARWTFSFNSFLLRFASIFYYEQ